MPKKITKRETKRPAPYNLRASASTSISIPVTVSTSAMATAIASPVSVAPPWTSHHSHTLSSGWPHNDPHMGVSYQQHPMLANFSMPMQPSMPQHQHHQSQSHLQPHSSHQTHQLPPQHPTHHSAPTPGPIGPGQSTPWTLEEDTLLMDAKSSGLGWNDIHQKYFPSKSGNACRKRHERLMVKLRTTDWDEVRIRRVMDVYNGPARDTNNSSKGGISLRQEFWSEIANRLGERWEDVERVCFQQGLKGLRTQSAASNGGGSGGRNHHHASSHSRGRSRASSGFGQLSEYEHTSSHEEYEQRSEYEQQRGGGYEQRGGGEYDQRGEYEHQKYPEQDDSGIDLGAPGPSRRTSMSHSVNVGMGSGQGTIPGIEQVMRQPLSGSGGYEYRV